MRFGLIGCHLSHSFSKAYFTDFFEREGLSHSYDVFDIDNIESIIDIIRKNRLDGLNVTSPYKEQIIPFLDEVDIAAGKIGAVNVVKIRHEAEKIILKGFNTDVIGFERLLSEAKKHAEIRQALVCGSGGASKAVQYVLKNNDIQFVIATRKNTDATKDFISYEKLQDIGLSHYDLIINATPLGMYPNMENCVALPFETMKRKSVAIDLIYNPEKTKFLRCAERSGAHIINGRQMLIGQAEAAWKIFEGTL